MDKGQIDEIRRRTSLRSLVATRVALQQRGRRYVGLCPFHNEKTPSFHVVEDDGFYYCFGCAARGDAFEWLQKTQGISFAEALAILAKQAGIVLLRKNETAQTRKARETGENIRNRLRQVITVAETFYHQELLGVDGAQAREYLQTRGINKNAAQRFALGWAGKDARHFFEYMKKQQCGEKELLEAGLAIPDDKNTLNLRARFRERIIFPIADHRGRTIAFGGRLIFETKNHNANETRFMPPKYLNSPETKLFAKGQNLYNLARAKTYARQKTDTSVLVEGYMDVIALDNAGFYSSIASLGTAVSEQQLNLLWQIDKQPVICFDADDAGANAATRAVKNALPIISENQNLRLLFLPNGEDPDSFVNKFGAEQWRKALGNAETVSEFLWRTEKGAHYPLQTPEKFAALDKALDKITSKISAATLQKHYRAFFKNALFQEQRKAQKQKSDKNTLHGELRNSKTEKSNILHYNNDQARRRRALQEKLLVAFARQPKLWRAYEERLANTTLPNDLEAARQAMAVAYADANHEEDLDNILWRSGGQVLQQIVRSADFFAQNPYLQVPPMLKQTDVHIEEIVEKIFAALDYIALGEELGQIKPEAQKQKKQWRDDARKIFTQT